MGSFDGREADENLARTVVDTLSGDARVPIRDGIRAAAAEPEVAVVASVSVRRLLDSFESLGFDGPFLIRGGGPSVDGQEPGEI
jgi:hypothetical protein